MGGLVGVKPVGGPAHFPAYDGNGNVAGLVNGVTGLISVWYEYGPFGEPLRVSGPMANANPIRFSTKYTDDTSQSVYYGYRYSNPSTGRWPSRDPMGERGGWNVFAFVDNNPFTYIDPTGLGTFSVVEAQIDFDRGKISPKAQAFADPNGFEVVYLPTPGECPKPGEIVVFQIISRMGGINFVTPYLDLPANYKKNPKCAVPPAMGPPVLLNGAEVPCSYVDSPTSTGFTKYGITAVAVCRTKCKDMLLARSTLSLIRILGSSI